MYSARATFVSGTYLIDPAIAHRPAAIAAQHEEAHGIIRRSTLYGHILNCLVPPGCETLAAEDVLAHKLFSRGRTSEEVCATFHSLIEATWAGDTEAVTRELASSPEYAYYYEIGVELTTPFEHLHIKSMVLEAVIRFCWSSVLLEDMVAQGLNRERLATLPAAAMPDVRLTKLRGDWPNVLASGFSDTLLGLPEFTYYTGRSFREVHDPLHSVVPDRESFAIVDTDGAIRRATMKMMETASIMSEMGTVCAADLLAEHYAGTDLAASTNERSSELILASRGATGKRSAAMNLIERVANLDAPRTIHLLETLEWDRAEERPIIGIRSKPSFDRNFQMTDDAIAPEAVDAATIYATAYNLGSNRYADIRSDPLPLAFCPPVDATAAERLQDWLPAPAIVALWSSTLLQEPSYWQSQIRRLARENAKMPWVVIDSDPRIALAALAPMFSEVSGFVHSPVAERPGLSGLAISPLSSTPTALRGFVFMGMTHTLEIIARTLSAELGSDFRGVGGPIFHEDTHRKRNEGRALVYWLSQNELIFDYRG